MILRVLHQNYEWSRPELCFACNRKCSDFICGSNMCSEYLGKEDGIIYKANVDESRSQPCCCVSRFIKNSCFDLFSSDFMEHVYEWPKTGE